MLENSEFSLYFLKLFKKKIENNSKKKCNFDTLLFFK